MGLVGSHLDFDLNPESVINWSPCKYFKYRILRNGRIHLINAPPHSLRVQPSLHEVTYTPVNTPAQIITKHLPSGVDLDSYY